jgi:hypothetical protein
MGREISSSEHRIPGIVTVGRPLRDLPLPPKILEMQHERLREIEVIKDLAKISTEQQVQVDGPPEI